MYSKFNNNCDNFNDVRKLLDYKDPKLIDFTSEYVGKIAPRRATHLNARLQRHLSREIKRARYLALLPYCSKHRKGGLNDIL